MSKAERVLVVPRRFAENFSGEAGVYRDDGSLLEKMLNSGEAKYQDRAEAEVDFTQKQLIPYVVFRFENKILSYKRGKSGGEARLHAKISIGIGGHINPIDGESAGMETYEKAMRREIDEELEIGSMKSCKLLAFINDDTNDVGKVHLGVLHLIELNSEFVRAKESGIAELRWREAKELQAKKDQLETWSTLAIDFICSGLA